MKQYRTGGVEQGGETGVRNNTVVWVGALRHTADFGSLRRPADPDRL